MASGIINHLRYTMAMGGTFTLDLNDAQPYPDGSERQYSFSGFTNITNRPSGVQTNYHGHLKAFKMGAYICQLLFCYQNYPAPPKIFYRAQTYDGSVSGYIKWGEWFLLDINTTQQTTV